jgi:hypothetical protein
MLSVLTIIKYNLKGVVGISDPNISWKGHVSPLQPKVVNKASQRTKFIYSLFLLNTYFKKI